MARSIFTPPMRRSFLFLINCLLAALASYAQPDEDRLGAWYMLFWSYDFKESPFGLQGDYQHRNWNMAGDLEQFMFRNGITYRPGSGDVKFTLGYAYIENGTFGADNANFGENRLYQEALLPQKVGDRFYITHRFRFEQRKLPDQDLRTRYRYFLSVNVPVNQPDLTKGAIYAAFYNELFINGERTTIDDGNEVEIFDRNRLYGGMGLSLSDKSRLQLGYMRQSTDLWSKNQVQVGLHQRF